ncbi:phage tail protein [Pinirhizobacter sp.]|jgi:microcystin-dependent protein|uniref:phage tail protein n=1 Tax=Pinirhizobacter sp. TaxID=2950432 RepID=UPI002F416BAA
MAQAFLGQIMLTPYNFAPKNFAQCNGQTMSISQNQALFSLLGVTYGGNGSTTFMLPNLQSRTPIGMGTAPSGSMYPIGQVAGTENVSLINSQVPPHMHVAAYSTASAAARSPANGLYGNTGSTSIYANAGGAPQQVLLNQATVSQGGGNQPHPNLQPYLALNFCIALNGIFPSRN